MPTAVAAARQSYADHPMVRLETAPPGPCHAVSLQETLSGTFTACATVILALFIDYQNAYRCARDAFFPNPQSGRDGHLKPMELGLLIESRGDLDGTPYSLSEVRVYSGRPNPHRAWRTFSAHRTQSHGWAQDGATVIERELRYPQGRPQEKGIDVALAIDFVRLAINGTYDVGVIMSTDNDLTPAFETVRDHGPSGCRIAVAAWGIQGQDQRLWLPNGSLWCHWLSLADYNTVADLTRY